MNSDPAIPNKSPKRPSFPFSDSFEGDLGLGHAAYHSPPPKATPRPLPPIAKKSAVALPKDSWPAAALSPETRQKLERWIVGFGLVKFNIDQGPELDQIYPAPSSARAPLLSATDFSEVVRANIAFSSLPEGDLPTAGAHTYSWRIAIPDGERRDGQGDGFLHGFVYFLQEQNKSLRRGYSQRSLVLITRLPSLVGLFSHTLSLLGQLYFKHPDGGMVIESACVAISNWPTRVPGTTLELPFLGFIQTVEFPLALQPQWQSPASFTDQSENVLLSVIPASCAPTPLSVVLHDTLSFSKILLLWELVLLGEPLLVYSKDPRTSSEIVHHLKNLIRPIPFASDYRPYFHIHDQDFRSILSTSSALPNSSSPKVKPKSKSGTIISSTNPQIISIACAGNGDWPNLLVMNSANFTTTTKKNGNGYEVNLGVVGLKTGSRKREVRKDKVVEKSVENAFKRGDYIACDALLFQHLTSLTERFLSPLNRYFGTLPSTSTSLLPPSLTQPFHVPTFLASLKSHGTTLPFRSSKTSHSASSNSSSSVLKFYATFLESANFNLWLEGRLASVEMEMKKRWLERVLNADLEAWSGVIGEGRDLASRTKLEKALVAELLAVENEQKTLSLEKNTTRSSMGLQKLAEAASRIQKQISVVQGLH